MNATIKRSGGFAGLVATREVEITPAQLQALRRQHADAVTPDAFVYEVTAGGETFSVSESPLLEALLR